MIKKKIRTIVCGSRFGQFYIEALIKKNDEFEVVGLFAKGSKRSIECCRNYGINLYTSYEDIPSDIDLACVVVKSAVLGGNGTDMCMEFLNRKINVVAEQPMHYKDLAKCIRAAKENKVNFMIGDLYIQLPFIKRFIKCTEALLKCEKINYIEAVCTTQVSFPMVHILSKLLPSIRPLKIDSVIKEVGPFEILIGKIGNVPFLLKADNRLDPKSPDNCLPMLIEFTIGTSSGTLSLTDTHGLVTWKPCLTIGEKYNIPGGLKVYCPENILDKSTEIIGKGEYKSYKEILSEYWPKAIGKYLIEMKNRIYGYTEKQFIERCSQNEILCAKEWQEITSALGYAELKDNSMYKFFDVDILNAAVDGIEE